MPLMAASGPLLTVAPFRSGMGITQAIPVAGRIRT
jgi:hypothetical protein